MLLVCLDIAEREGELHVDKKSLMQRADSCGMSRDPMVTSKPPRHLGNTGSHLYSQLIVPFVI